ncbi:hypothetical protein ACE1SV_30420 [Streptomyces sp. E-15]
MVGGGGEGLVQTVVPVQRQGVQQGLLVLEVPARRGMAHAGVPGQFPQRERARALLAQGAFGAREEGGAQIAVVVPAARGRRR